MADNSRSAGFSPIGFLVIAGLAVWFVVDYPTFESFVVAVGERFADLVMRVAQMISERSSL